MYVGGTVISSVEFHGNMSLVIFMSKCPLACRYCHNVELLEDNTEKSFEEVKEEIDSSADFLDAIVVSGGEPLVQTDAVIEIFKYVRQIGLKTKLDTSGIYPENHIFVAGKGDDSLYGSPLSEWYFYTKGDENHEFKYSFS